MSLDPYPLQANTLLDAVNICLRAAGSANVLALDTDSLTPDSETALKTVHDTSIQCQSDGWQWNTEKGLVLGCHPQDGTAASGVVQLPANLLKLMPTFKQSTGQQLTQRGQFLYDPWASTFNIGESVTARLVVALDYEDLPQAARQYIALHAARVFVAGKLNNQITTAEEDSEEMQCWLALLEAEDEADDLTWPEKNGYLGARARHRRETT